MKKEYIKPEMVMEIVMLESMLASSPNTENMGPSRHLVTRTTSMPIIVAVAGAPFGTKIAN